MQDSSLAHFVANDSWRSRYSFRLFTISSFVVFAKSSCNASITTEILDDILRGGRCRAPVARVDIINPSGWRACLLGQSAPSGGADQTPVAWLGGAVGGEGLPTLFPFSTITMLVQATFLSQNPIFDIDVPASECRARSVAKKLISVAQYDGYEHSVDCASIQFYVQRARGRLLVTDTSLRKVDGWGNLIKSSEVVYARAIPYDCSKVCAVIAGLIAYALFSWFCISMFYGGEMLPWFRSTLFGVFFGLVIQHRRDWVA